MTAEYFRAALLRFVLIGAAWVVLTGGSTSYWGLALLIILASTVTSMLSMPVGAWRWSLPGLARFIPYFLWQSLVGGIDVSRRAFSPSLPIQPGILTYKLRIPPGPERVFFANSLSLQPGTAVASLEGDLLVVHALDTSMQIERDIRVLEERVAGVFGLTLPAIER